MDAAILFTHVSVENKLLAEEASRRGLKLERICDSEVALDVHAPGKVYDAVLQRSYSFLRGLYITRFMEENGSFVVNSFDVQRLCGDKALTSLSLARGGVPTPRTRIAFSREEALRQVESLGFPVVIKPVIGSWARLVSKLNDREAAEGVIESREQLGGFHHKVYYLQEHINKPGRDIRAFVIGGEVVAAIYRISGGSWITNTSRGGRAENCPVTPELEGVCLKAAEAVGGGILGVDLMESEGYLVHEVNHVTEFRNSVAPTGVNIPGKMIDYMVKEAKS